MELQRRTTIAMRSCSQANRTSFADPIFLTGCSNFEGRHRMRNLFACDGYIHVWGRHLTCSSSKVAQILDRKYKYSSALKLHAKRLRMCEMESSTSGPVILETQSPFDSLSKLSADLVVTGKYFMKFAGHFVTLDGDKRSFNWPGFIFAVQEYSGDYLKDIPCNSLSTAQGSTGEGKVGKCSFGDDEPYADVASEMTERLVKDFREKLHVEIEASELKAAVEATFYNLKYSKEQGWADFYESSHGTNTGWEYRVVFATPNAQRQDEFRAVVATIYLEADIREESYWWGLSHTTKATFFAKVIADCLDVVKGFQYPA